MRFIVKIIACIVLLVIGVSATSGIVFSMLGATQGQTGSVVISTPIPSPSVQPTQSSEAKPQFNVDVVYAYVGKGPSEAPHSHFDGVLMYPTSLYPSVVYFNFTRVSNAESESCDTKFEVYLIRISSDKGSAENYVYSEGTNYNPSLDMIPNPSLDTLIDTGPTSEIRAGGGFVFNWTTNTSSLGSIGSYGSYGSGESGLGLWSAGEPNTISISVRRLGWITFNGTSTVTTLASAEEIVQVQLEKFGDGFLYNKIVPEDKLSQMDLFRPPIWGAG